MSVQALQKTAPNSAVRQVSMRPRSVTGQVRPEMRTRVYLFLLLLALPIDYFAPTAALLREAGAKPAIPLMLLGTAWIIYRHWVELLFASPRLWRTLLMLCAAITCLSFVAFAANIGLQISNFGGLRNPFEQFVSQGLLFLLVPPVLITHAWLFSRPEVRSVFVRFLRPVVMLHLALLYAEWFGLLQPTTFPLSIFRGDLIVVGRKPTGLMTEPSYVGAFAAIYGLALLLCMPRKRISNQVLAFGSMITALLIGGKTMLPVMLTGLLAYGYQVRARILQWRVIAAAVGLALFSVYIVASYSVLNVRSNLSSAMRLGSTLLAMNAAAGGYGLLGIGFGQFHFVYLPRFAPSFLAYSSEARDFFAGVASVRASTFNLPVRFWLEEGILGLLLFLALVRLTFRNGRANDDLWHRLGAVVAGSSLGFLLTQDTYFYPAFVCGAAILASCLPQL